MIVIPNRVKQLRETIESGEPVTQKDVDRLATLQVLDLVVMGREFVEQAVVRQETEDARIEDHLSANS